MKYNKREVDSFLCSFYIELFSLLWKLNLSFVALLLSVYCLAIF